MIRQPDHSHPVDAAFVLPIGFTGMLLIGVTAVVANGRLGGTGVLVATSLLVAGTAALAQPLAAAPLAAIGWFTVAGFSRPPYAELHLHGTALPAAMLAGVAVGAAAAGAAVRRLRSAASRYTTLPVDVEATLEAVNLHRDAAPDNAPPPQVTARTWPPAPRRAGRRPAGVGPRRLAAGLALAAIVLPVLTMLLALARSHLALVDELLLYLLAVIVVTLVGGFWPAVFAAITAGVLLNWFFTPPVHTWTIDAPTNLLALFLFVTSAVTVSSVVHLAARRDAIATERTAEAGALLALARTVLGGDDSPQAILDHLTDTVGLPAELQERSGGRWVRVAGAPSPPEPHTIPAGADLQLIVYGDVSAVSSRVLEGFAAQAAAACERQRLRIQAGQAEALAEGNRMRTALLAAVSHDLRTPLASVKAAVSTLRQTDVQWSEQDRAALLATIEEGADRLDSLIANLLDMSRIQTGAVTPFVRPVALDEVVPLVAGGLDGADQLRVAIPDALPLLLTDPGLLERALANLVANALRYSPRNRPPTLTATTSPDDIAVTVRVIDHGPGIPPDQRERVFEPFQRLGDSGTDGVGLGLAVAKGFIEAVAGHLVAESTPGGGLTMRVELPIAARDGAGARP